MEIQRNCPRCGWKNVLAMEPERTAEEKRNTFLRERYGDQVEPVRDAINKLTERFGDRVKEVEEAINILEALQFSIRSEDDGHDFYVEGPGYFLEKGPLKNYQLVAFANSRLREISDH